MACCERPGSVAPRERDARTDAPWSPKAQNDAKPRNTGASRRLSRYCGLGVFSTGRAGRAGFVSAGRAVFVSTGCAGAVVTGAGVSTGATRPHELPPHGQAGVFSGGGA